MVAIAESRLTQLTSTLSPSTPLLGDHNAGADLADPFEVAYGDRLARHELDATASVPGSFLYTPAPRHRAVRRRWPGLSVTFTPTDTADYDDATASVLIDVRRAAPTAAR